MKIERLPARAGRRSGASAYKDLVWAVATADDRTMGVKGQATQAFAKIDAQLRELGSAPDRVITAAVYLADIRRKAELEEAWDEWVPQESANWPMRSCVQAALATNVLVEVVVTAVRDSPGWWRRLMAGALWANPSRPSPVHGTRSGRPGVTSGMPRT